MTSISPGYDRVGDFGLEALGFGAGLRVIGLVGGGRAIARQQQESWLAVVTLGIVERRARIHEVFHSS
jgi:hypothetical protein